MKNIMRKYLLPGIILVIAATSCRKNINAFQEQAALQGDSAVRPFLKPDTLPKAQAVPFPQTVVMGCPFAPDYGDSVIYPQSNGGQDYIVSPVNSPGAGKYFSWPQGMVIDSLTGAINVTKSETGLRYAIGFVKNGSTDTCLSNLIVGGASYMDSIYILDSGEDTARPYFDANPYLPAECAGGGCTFDVTGAARSRKIFIDPVTGKIDLKKTLNGTGLLGGAFGLLPLNGQTITTTIYYRLNDASNNALQHIDVQLVYYYSKSQIGSGLLNNVLTKLTNLLMGNMISTYSNPRPPLIVIVRKNM